MPNFTEYMLSDITNIDPKCRIDPNLATLTGMVTPGRFELPTCGLGNRRSIHLSYGATPSEFTLQSQRDGRQLITNVRHEPGDFLLLVCRQL